MSLSSAKQLLAFQKVGPERSELSCKLWIYCRHQYYFDLFCIGCAECVGCVVKAFKGKPKVTECEEDLTPYKLLDCMTSDKWPCHGWTCIS